MKTGIFFINDLNTHVDLSELKEYAKTFDQVVTVWDQGNLISSKDIITDIEKQKLEKIIIVGNEPGYYQPWLASVMKEAGRDPGKVILVSCTEHGLNGGLDTDWVSQLIYCAVNNLEFERVAIPDLVEVNPETMVIGGGIAGIQASLEIADSGNKVHLIERTGTIGGHMAMFDKTFPTLDCAACILTPKMVEVSQHNNIDLLTNSEVAKVEGRPGNYKVTLLKKARRVDEKKCISCGICAEKCPSKVSSEFDAGTTLRKAVYIPFPQAVPNKYLVDPESCRYVTEGKCGVCAKVCPAGCIDLDEKDQEVVLEVGNIIVATGFKVFDAEKMEQFGYGIHPNVLTSLEFERLVNASGPTGGNIHYRRQDKKGNWVFTDEGEEPSSVALIHCVGSRDENHNKYCSRVCCMYSLKMAHLIKEKLPEAEVTEYYIDMRAFGKGYEEFYQRIKEEGVNMIRGKTATVKSSGEKLLLRSEDIEHGRLIEQEVDMVVLAVGLEPRSDARELAQTLGITLDENGWFMEANTVADTTGTYTGGITIAGVCQGPKDIPDSVAQGSAAAAKVLQSILTGKIRTSMKDLTLEDLKKKEKEITIMEEK